MQDIAIFALDLHGPGRHHDRPGGAAAPARFQAHADALAARLRIDGGTDEILRNIIAERVLGLPADIRVDKDSRSTRSRPRRMTARDLVTSPFFSLAPA